jgi:hypothetical protein
MICYFTLVFGLPDCGLSWLDDLLFYSCFGLPYYGLFWLDDLLLYSCFGLPELTNHLTRIAHSEANQNKSKITNDLTRIAHSQANQNNSKITNHLTRIAQRAICYFTLVLVCLTMGYPG